MKKRYRMHDKCGKKIDGKLRVAGAMFLCDPVEAAKHPELTEVDADGKPVPAPPKDKIANRETGEANAQHKR